MRSGIVTQFIVLGILVAPTPCQVENELYRTIFESAWTKVDDTYFDPTFGGLDWKDVHDRHLPEIAAATKDEELYGIVNAMLWELGVSHANLLPLASLALHEPLTFAQGSPGLDVRWIGEAAVVTAVVPDWPAAEAGLRPGHVIRVIDGIPIDEIVGGARLHPPYNNRGRIATITKAILGRIHGPPETEVSIVFSDGNGKEQSKSVSRRKRNGVTLGPGLFLATDFEARLLEGGIAYLRVNTLQPQFAALISEALESMGEVSAVVFDLRGNSGGEIEQMPELFLNERTLLYLRRSRSGEDEVFFEPAEGAFAGPLALLIDPLSGSASELLAAGLQAAGRAVVVGERSPGSVMEMDRQIFQNGAILMYPVAQLLTPDGTVLEGHGVVPDLEVELDRAMLLEGIDSQLEAAVRHLEERARR